METILMITAVAWFVTGANLLWAMNKESHPDLRRID